MVIRTFDLLDDFNRAYGNLFRSPLFRSEQASLAGGDWLPPADIKEAGDHYLITLDVPGATCDQIEVTAHEGVLTIRGRRETESKKNENLMIRIERSSGQFIRQFQLPGLIDADTINAHVQNGVLTIVVPKAEESQPKRITVS